MTDLIKEVRAALSKASVDYTKETAYLISKSDTWLTQLTDQLEEALKALDWYGNEDNHRDTAEEYQGKSFMKDASIKADYGELARTTLKKIKEMN
jgi:hypothetical protein